MALCILLAHALARAQSPGELDTSFNPGTGADWRVLGIARQADGKLVVAGQFNTFNGLPRNRITRLNADGSTDLGFNPGKGADSTINAVAVTADGKVLVGGDFYSFDGQSWGRLARLTSSGLPDSTFAIGSGVDGSVQAVLAQADGKVLLAGGFTTVNGVARNRIARLNADGSLDASFNPGSGANAPVLALALQADGKILMGGYFSSVNGATCHRVARLNIDGSLDTSFVPGTVDNGYVNGISPTSDGKVFVAGGISVGIQSRLLRLLPDGGVDHAFNPGNNAINSDVTSVIAQSDGKVLLAGYFTAINGVSRNGVARMNADGSLDPAFNPGSGANQLVWTMVLQPDGRLVAGGAFTTYAGVSRNRLTRIHNDGASANQAPQMAAIGSLTILEDSGSQSVTVTGITPGPAGETAQSVTNVTAVSSNPSLIPNPSVTYTSGAPTATLGFTPAANANGSVIISVVAQDNGGTAFGGVDKVTNSFTVTVTPVNDAPSFTLATTDVINRMATGWGDDAAGQTTLPAGLTNVVSIASGAEHTLVLLADGTVLALGGNSFGQATVPPGLSDVRAIAAGTFFSLAAKSDGSVVAWGRNSVGQTSVPAGLTGVIAVAGGEGHALALKSDGTVEGWGTALGGELDVVGATGVRAIAAGRWHSLLLHNDGTVSGAGTYRFSGAATPPAGLVNVTAIAAGEMFSLALRNDGTVVAWGGEYVRTNASYNGVLTAPPGLSGVTNIAAGYFHALALKDNGTVTAWGGNGSGQATVPAGLANVVGIAAGWANSFAITSQLFAPALLPVVVLEDAGLQTIPGAVRAASPGPANESAQLVSFLVANDNSALFSSPPAIAADGTLTFTPALNATGTATVTVRAQDDGGTANGGVDTSAPQTFTITVTPVNDAPTITLTTNLVVVAEGSGAYGANLYASVSVGPPDEAAAQTLTNVTVLSVSNPALFSAGPALALNGTLTFTPAASASGSALITFAAQDNGGTVNGGVDRGTNSFTITVLPLNHEPTFTLNPTIAWQDFKVLGWGRNDAGQADTPLAAQSGVIAVAGGGTHTLALKRDGTVAAWGDNTFQQTDVPAAAQTGVSAIATHGHHSLALTTGGSVVAWGLNGDGQTNVPASAASGVSAIAAGFYHSLALKADGTVVAWGRNNYGQTTVPAGAQSGVIAIAAGFEHSLALKADGSVVAWGRNSFGQAAVPLDALSGVTAIAAGISHSLALKTDGSVVTWGNTSFGLQAVPAEAQSGVVAIAGGGNYSLALKSDGTVIAWGDNGQGETTIPAAVQGSAAAISGGGNHGLALVPSGALVVREDAGPQSVSAAVSNISPGPASEAGQIVSFVVTNDNPALFSAQPALAANGTLAFTSGPNANGSASVTVVAVDNGGAPGVSNSAPQAFTLTITPVNDAPSFALGSEAVTNHTVLAWGAQSQSAVPAGLTGVTALSVSSSHTLALKSDGTLVAWGDNAYGKATVPAGLTGVIAVAAGSDYSLAARSDGTVTGWGNNYPYAQATPPAGLSGVTALAAGRTFNLALRNDGTVVEWGYAGYYDTRMPPGLSGVTAIAAGAGHRLALKSDGTVVVWGASDFGVLNVPSGLSGVIAIAAGDYHSLALKNDGTVVTWGNSIYYPAGEVPLGLTGVTRIAAGGGHSLALLSNGRIVGWGQNQLSQATHPSGLTGVTVIAAGGDSSVAVGDVVTGSPFAVTVQMDSGPQTVLNAVVNISAGPPDEVAQAVSFTLTNNYNALFTPGGQPAIDGGGTLTFTPASGAAGRATVTVIARDNGGTANGGVDTSGPRTFDITVASVKVFVSDSPVVIAGSTVEVPISLAGIGTEGGVSFTLTYDRPRLVFQSVAVESGSGLTLTWSEPAVGMMNNVGIIVTKPAGTSFPAGTNAMVRLTFQAPIGTAPTNTPISFSSAVVMQQVSDTSANAIANVLYVPGSVTVIAVPPLEGDVAPRNASGNGTVTVSDAVQLSRFVAGWDPITDFTANGEFQRADCAPRGTLGDGRVTLIDLVQTLRYAAGLDPATPAGGPMVQAASVATSRARLAAGTRVVRVVGGNLFAGRVNTVSVQLDAQGNEAGVSLSLGFDPTAVTFVSATVGNGANGASLMVNNAKAAAGRVGLVLVMPAGSGIPAGTRDIITLTFNVMGTGTTAVTVSGDTPVAREIADVSANLLGASFVGGSFNLILPPGLKAAGLERATDGSLRLVVVNTDSSPVTAAQAARYQVQVTSDLGGAWTVLPDALVIENGVLKIVDPAASGAGLRFYKLIELSP